MNSVLLVVLSVLMSLTVPEASAQPASTARLSVLPGEVVQFYAELNFVAAFSDVQDRRQVRGAFRRQHLLDRGFDLDLRPGDLTVESLSPRLRDVGARLIRIEARTLRIDDIAVLGLGMREGAATAELLRVIGQESSDGVLRVRVEAWPITVAFVERLRFDYEQRGRREVDPVPPPEARAGPRRLEIHRWRPVGNQWMRMDGATLQDRKKPR